MWSGRRPSQGSSLVRADQGAGPGVVGGGQGPSRTGKSGRHVWMWGGARAGKQHGLNPEVVGRRGGGASREWRGREIWGGIKLSLSLPLSDLCLPVGLS